MLLKFNKKKLKVFTKKVSKQLISTIGKFSIKFK